MKTALQRINLSNDHLHSLMGNSFIIIIIIITTTTASTTTTARELSLLCNLIHNSCLSQDREHNGLG